MFTIGHALKDYLEWKQVAAAESYFLTTVTMINHHLVPRIATLPAADFSGARVRDFVTEILETPPKKGNRPAEPRRPVDTFDPEEQRKRRKTANTLLGIVKAALEMAWENERLDNDRLFRRIKKLRNVDRPRVLHLTRDECRRFIDACPSDFRTLVMAALYTGCRRSELMRMQAVHVGCDGYGVHVTPVKATKPRFVFLPDEGMAFFLALARGKKPDEFLFRQQGGTSWKYNFRHKFDTAKKRAGIVENFTFHGLRHTYASQLIQAGAPLIVVADQLGHASTQQVVNTYGHLSPQIRESEVRQRFTSISREFEAIADADGEKLAAWRKTLHGGGWRTYATIHDLASVRNTRH